MYRLYRKLMTLFGRGRREQDLQDELAAHLAMDMQERIDAGESPDVARFAAQRDFGHLLITTEDTRATWGWPGLEQLVQDLRHAAHTLWRQPAFSAAAVLTLAIGIGATTVIFSIVNGVLLQPLPYPEPDQLVSLEHVTSAGAAASADFLYFTYAGHNEAFQASGLWGVRAATITGQGGPEQIPAVRVTPEVLSLLGVYPARGRLFTAADGQPDNPLTTVLTYGYWQRRFGGDELVLGQRLMIDNLAHEIVGYSAPLN